MCTINEYVGTASVFIKPDSGDLVPLDTINNEYSDDGPVFNPDLLPVINYDVTVINTRAMGTVIAQNLACPIYMDDALAGRPVLIGPLPFDVVSDVVFIPQAFQAAGGYSTINVSPASTSELLRSKNARYKFEQHVLDGATRTFIVLTQTVHYMTFDNGNNHAYTGEEGYMGFDKYSRYAGNTPPLSHIRESIDLHCQFTVRAAE